MAEKIGSSDSSGSLAGGVVAAILASICCVGPLLLVTLGIGGTWIAQLAEFEAVRPLFIGLTLLFLGLAFRRLYFAPKTCVPGTICSDPRTMKRQRTVFWVVSTLLAGLISIPWVAPVFF
ncbi:MAG TPA: mercuric transporter MerT family protein [Burkholderiales bacterium]|jgi:mercuric ion transport protein|nr:mercuric transporter MerT family protein [Burkholderiales bacterium]